jgi:hypothetical protein
MPNYDSAWKEALEWFLRLLLALLFPKVEQDVDWTLGYESFEQELRPLIPEGETGLRLAVKLFRVHTLHGDERSLNVEVQAQPRQEFSRRVYVYNYRSDDRFSGPPESLVVLADDNPDWRPTTYEVRLHYVRMTFVFEPVKLLDWAQRKDELRRHENPMALFILAHLEAQRTHGDDEERARVKLDLLVLLAERTLDEDDWRHWHRFLSWLLNLPAELDDQVFAQAKALTKKEEVMGPVGYAERYELRGRTEGKIVGLLAGIEAVLEVRFGVAGLDLMPEVRKVETPERLSEVLQAAKASPTLDDVRKLLTSTDAPAS